MSKIFKWLFFAVVMIAIFGGVGYWYVERAGSVRNYSVTRVFRGNVTQTVFAMGDVLSPGGVDLSFKTSGKVTYIGANVGDRVAAGQRIAEIDLGSLKQQIQRAKADIVFQTATLNDMRSTRNKTTFSKEQRDAQRANVESSQFALAALEEQQSELVLYAPKDGIVLRKNFHEGEFVTAGQTVFSLAGENDREIQARVPEAAINKVAIGQTATAIFDALPQEKFQLDVTEIEPDATIIQGNRYYFVKLHLQKEDTRIKNGMSPEIHIATAFRENTLMLPASAFHRGENGVSVDVIQPDQETIRSVNVKTGLQGDKGLVEVLSGVSDGDPIAF